MSEREREIVRVVSMAAVYGAFMQSSAWVWGLGFRDQGLGIRD